MFLPRVLSDDLVARVARWDELKRWERREIGQTLRKMGLSYREIRAVVPVPKGTLSVWCRDLGVEPAHRARTEASRSRVGSLLRQRALDRASSIRREGKQEAVAFLADPGWVAGVVAYWSEGAKRTRQVAFSNSDPDLVVLFIGWSEIYLGADRSSMTAKLHLHSGQDEAERTAFWSAAAGIPLDNFRKTYIKPEGTGHRKNVLYNGTATIWIPRSGDLLHRILGWIDALADLYREVDYTAAGR